jgi:hypothetical protein
MACIAHFRGGTLGKVTFGGWFLAGPHSRNLYAQFLATSYLTAIRDFDLAVASQYRRLNSLQ